MTTQEIGEFCTHAVKRVHEFHQAFDVTAATAHSRRLLITEEFLEYEKAAKSNNPVEILDGLIDCIYINAGTIDLLAPQMAGLIHTYQPDAFTNVMLKLLASIFRRDNWCAKTTPRLLLHANAAATVEIVNRFNYAVLYDAFACVQRANMEKFWLKAELDASHISGTWAFKRLEGTDMYIVKDENGKIRKPPHWQPPDLGSVLSSHGFI